VLLYFLLPEMEIPTGSKQLIVFQIETF